MDRLRSRACAPSLLAIGFCAIALCPTTALAQPTPEIRDAVGYTALVSRLGGAVPTGLGVIASQVEAAESTSPLAYAPKLNHADFAGKTFTLESGASGQSNHATGVGVNFYGNQSFAPAITEIHNYWADDWLVSGGLRFREPVAPDVETAHVQNHSWIGSATTSESTDLLRRLDYQIQRDNVVTLVGVNNGVGSAVPPLLSNAYNALAVGRTDGNSSAGTTTVDAAGRVAVDIVAPGPNTSTATPWVSSAASLLIDAANGNFDATRSQTIRAVLLAGATKGEFDTTNQTPTLLDNWSRTTTRPLDLRFGAGELNIDNSHRILTSPQQEANPAALVNPTGWDFDNVAGGTNNLYFFQIPEYTELDSLSIIAEWNRAIAFTPGSGSGPATLTPSLANVDIKLFNASSFGLGTMIDQSVSTIDNVEHIWQQNLAPGQYAIQLLTNSTVDVALAWDSILTLLDVPGDGNGDRRVTGADFTIWSDNFGLFDGDADASNGDYNGDGFVTGADFTVWSDHFGIDATITSLSSSQLVPEPGAALLAGLALASLVALRWRRAGNSRG